MDLYQSIVIKMADYCQQKKHSDNSHISFMERVLERRIRERRILIILNRWLLKVFILMFVITNKQTTTVQDSMLLSLQSLHPLKDVSLSFGNTLELTSQLLYINLLFFSNQKESSQGSQDVFHSSHHYRTIIHSNHLIEPVCEQYTCSHSNTVFLQQFHS